MVIKKVQSRSATTLDSLKNTKSKTSAKTALKNKESLGSTQPKTGGPPPRPSKVALSKPKTGGPGGAGGGANN